MRSVLLLCACALLCPSAAGGQVSDPRYIVEVRSPGAGGPDSTQYETMVGPAGRIWYRYSGTIWGFAASFPDSTRTRLQGNPQVILIEPDASVTNAEPVIGQSSDAQPGWDLSAIGAADLPGTTGDSVTVYVLDSGIRASHDEFEGRASLAIDLVGGTNNAGDCNGHGTHVAGAIAGQRFGIAHAARIVAIRVLDCDNFGMHSTILKGLQWVLANARRPAVVNLSLAADTGRLSSPIVATVEELIRAGITVVAAAGNFGSNACEHAPGVSPLVITVGAVDRNNKKLGMSSWGECVKIFAPGRSIWSASNRGDGRYEFRNGTSQASARVAGAVAMILGEDPNLNPPEVMNRLFTLARSGVTEAEAGSPDRMLYLGRPSPRASGAGSPRG